MERQLEYEKGPPTGDDSDDERATTTAGTETPPSELRGILALPWRVGLLFGLGAFLVNYAVTLQAVAATSALHGFAEEAPGAWVSTGLVLLSNHGVSITTSEEAFPFEIATMLSAATPITHFVPLVTLALAGYGVARYAGLETVRSVATGALTVVPSYLVSVVALALLATYTFDPAEVESTGGGMGPDEAVTYSASMVETVLLAGLLVPAVLALAGGLLAIWPRPLERLLGGLPRETAATPDDATPRE